MHAWIIITAVPHFHPAHWLNWAKWDWRVKDRDWINTVHSRNLTLKSCWGPVEKVTLSSWRTTLKGLCNGGYLHFCQWYTHTKRKMKLTSTGNSDSKHTPREQRKDEFFCHTTFEAYLFHLEANCFQMHSTAKPNCKHPLIFFPALLQKHPVLIFFSSSKKSTIGVDLCVSSWPSEDHSH